MSENTSVLICENVNMATSSTTREEDWSQFTCPVCLEIYDKPVMTTCGHTYCVNCLRGYSQVAEPHCPLCRNVFNPRMLSKNTTMERAIAAVKTHCKGCNRKMSLGKLRGHQQMCSKMRHQAPATHFFAPVAQTSQPVSQSQPNRSTFACPYCGLRNFDSASLIKHCNEMHSNSEAAVVCPICSSMPWGNPNQTSTNFIQHLNLRHKFEYDTFVDYHQDDDTMFQAALRASMMET